MSVKEGVQTDRGRRPSPARRRGRRPRAVLAVLCAVAGPVLAAGVAPAQVLDNWSRLSGIDPLDRRPSARLQALGGLEQAVADENNEIQLLDFAGNLAGHLTDKPGTHIDAFSGPRRWRDRTTPSLDDQDFEAMSSSFFVNMRTGSRVALGGSAGLVTAQSSRLVNDALRAVFTLPLEDSPIQPTQNEIFMANIAAPAFSVHFVRALTDRVALGAEWGYLRERETKETGGVGPYIIRHTSNRHSIKGSLAVDVIAPGSGGGGGVLRGLTVGGNGRLGRANITGTSDDELHDDTLEWERPFVDASAHAIVELGADQKAGLDFRYSSFEGEETAFLNWSSRFLLNPGDETIKLARATFREGRRFRGFRARWEQRPRRRPVYLAGAFAASQGEYWQFLHTNVNAYRVPKALQATTWKAVGGGSYYLGRGRGLVAGEVAYGFSDFDDRLSRPVRTAKTSTLELGAGAEYFPRIGVGVRGGYRWIVRDGDRDRDDPTADTDTHRLGAGFGFRTADGTWHLDVGYSYDRVTSDDPAGVVDDKNRSQLTVQVRWLM